MYIWTAIADLGWGSLKPIANFPSYAKFWFNAVGAPVKYERDIVHVTGLLMNLKKWEINGTGEICFVTQTPG